MAADGDNDTPTAQIEDNKTVRRMRGLGCTCAWHWVAGEDPGDIEPAVEQLADGCPVTGTGQTPHP